MLIPDVLGQGDYRVLVVDDDSPDGTGAVADALAREHPGRVEVLHRRGRRGLDGTSVVNWPLHRIALSAAANRYVRAITGVPVADCTSGFRCWRRAALGRIPLDRLVSNGYAFLIETLHEALRHGARIGEVPIVWVERRHGRSKVSLNVLAESLLMPWRVRFRPHVRPCSD